MKAGFSNQITWLALPSLSFLLTIFYFVYQSSPEKQKQQKRSRAKIYIQYTYQYIVYPERERFFLGTGYAVVGAGKSEVHRAGQKFRQELTLQS